MALSRHYIITLSLVLFGSTVSHAQELTEKIWAVFAYSLHGESTPTLLPRSRTLTPYGANELYTAGSIFRDRYVAIHPYDPYTTTRIQGISAYTINTDQVDALSTAEPFVAASAQAFMQGLYPPLGQSFNGNYMDALAELSNGSSLTYPLNGYQYPQIMTLGWTDPNSIRVAGQVECLRHQVAEWEYQASSEFQQIKDESEAFYIRLYDDALSGVYERSASNYLNAYYISEYLDYQALHNSTFLHNIVEEDIIRARWFADQYAFATNSNKSSPRDAAYNDIRSIAGQTLASHILDAFISNIEEQGSKDKMTLLFGSHEPAVALASLLQLASPTYANFYSRPALGASMVFELFSYSDETYPGYPSPSELYVRFVLQNGTDTSAEFISYPLFGHGPSNIAIPFDEFRAEMEQIALGTTDEWCLACDSTAVFCSGVLGNPHSAPSSKKGLDPAVAGVIGAVVTLVVVALVVIAGFLLSGSRLQRRRKSQLGGFKGTGKMASDSDVTFKSPIWGDSKMTGNQQPPDYDLGGIVVRGHERSGSWEMKQQKDLDNSGSAGIERTASAFEDENEEEWRVHSNLQPVRVRESI